MTKVKKNVVAILITLLAAVLIIIGLLIYSGYLTKESGNLKISNDLDNGVTVYEEEIKIGSVDKSNYDIMIQPDYFYEILEKTDGKYLWIEDGEIVGSNIESLANHIKDNLYNEDSNLSYYDLLGLQESLINVISNFTDGYNQSTYKFKKAYWKYGQNVSCFNGLFPEDENLGDENHNSNPLKLKGLNLEVKNIQIEKIICSKDLILNGQQVTYIVQATFDVKCEKITEEVYEHMGYWLPEKGQTKRVKMAYILYTDNYLGGRVIPQNIYFLQEM